MQQSSIKVSQCVRCDRVELLAHSPRTTPVRCRPPQDSGNTFVKNFAAAMARVKLNWTDLLAIEPPGPSGVSSVP